MRKTKYLISVLISVYNEENNLDKTFSSLADQTYQMFDILCINDNSTDQTKSKLKKWENIFKKRLMIINNQFNIGLTKSLNKGLALISSRFIARLDAGDWWNSSKLETQVNYLKLHPEIGILGCNYINHVKNRQNYINLPSTDFQIRSQMIKKNPLAHSCVVMNTTLIKQLGGYDENVKFGQDYDLWLRCLPKTKFANLTYFLCHRTTGQGISVTHQKRQMLQSVKTQIKYIHLYHLPIINFLYVVEPMMIALAPGWLLSFKRKII